MKLLISDRLIMKNLISLAIIILFLSLISCSHTRIEEDTFTITIRDTTYQRFVNNAPGNKDNGQIMPSSRTFENQRTVNQYDSIVTRTYPDFIRLGLFESIGMMGSSSKNKLAPGLFGLFYDPENLTESFKGDDKATFSGAIYKLGIFEYRLRWFRDAKNWTIGTHALEYIAPDVWTDNSLASIFPLYLRKRYYLYEKIPYVAVTLAGGIGWWPSQYLNLSASLDLGSIGGLNLRTYLGFVAGYNSSSTPQIHNSNNPDKTVSVAFPYFGLGVSVLDFHNLVHETETEWKFHEHSSWDVGLLQIGMLYTTADESVFQSKNDTTEKLFKGFSLKLANAQIAIPVLNNRFYAGTSLLNILLLGKKEWAVSVLPIRLGYWLVLLEDELSLDPFIEYNYFPSNFVNLGSRLNLKISDNINLSLLFAYASGKTDLGYDKSITDEIGLPGEFSRPYVGISLNIWDRIFYPQELRYNK